MTDKPIYDQENREERPAPKKGKKKRRIFAKLVFLLGFLIFIYPVISRLYYRVETTKVVSDFSEGKRQLDQEEINKRYALAKAYNAALSGKTQAFHDPYVDNVEQGVANYAHMLEVREKIGVIRIPSIEVEEPIYAGTSEEVLQKGTGHLEYTSLPIGGESTHAVITGHRGLPDKRIFTPLDKMKEGDVFYIENIKETIAYEVDQIKVIEPTDFEDLKIVEGKDYVTLLTCTPYMINTHRLLVRGHRVPYVPEKAEKEVKEAKSRWWIKIAAIAGGVLLLFLLWLWRRHRRKKGARGREQKA